MGEGGNHFRHGPLGRALDTPCARDDVYGALAVRAPAQVDRPYRGAAPTLAEHLRAHAYQTAGIVANVRMCNIAYGVGRGFDYYLDDPGNQEISFRAMLYNSALGSVVMKLCRRMGLPITRPAPFGL